ncbi:Transcription initiation factor TFIID subunit 11 [Psilocybe cubensis]|uniref:Transcription initiation factor TFIID subunit 11 n=2 Tax=Psilocybe cubensis TaxID=181762 RepID=A0A8H7XNB7_PSICU|nr:Transcription initiation factor TFIID subunit 11 [Psilocybe cubensis]KAH9475207.1 Transcription initiation factor TFIID subunit 11 [Psilocybe cubensis]
MTTPYSGYTPSTASQPSYPANSGQTTPVQTTSTPSHFTSVLSNVQYDSQSQPGTPTPAGRGRPRGSATGAKRGRKPKNPVPEASSPRPFITNSFVANPSPAIASGSASSSTSGPNPQYPRVHWAIPPPGAGGVENAESSVDGASGSAVTGSNTNGEAGPSNASADQPASASGQNGTSLPIITGVIDPALTGATGVVPSGSQRGTPAPEGSAGLSFYPSRGTPQPQSNTARGGTVGVDDEAEGDDELLPAMADDDYSAQLSWQSQSKDNLKVLMDNLSPAQYDRFEAYRRHALPKQAVRKVIQQTLGQQVSQPVAQIIAGFSKVFVGEIVEKARAVQTRRGDTGPLSPDHLREAYRAYQEETGHVGAARPIRAKKLFVR